MVRLDQEWTLTPWRAAVHEPTATAVIADLHLGHASVRQAVGEAVPDMEDDLVHARLQALRQAGIRRLVIAGDLVERGRDCGAVAAAWSQHWTEQGFELLLVQGNHDAGLRAVPGLRLLTEPFILGGWEVRHEPPAMGADAGPPPPRPCMAGHLHPVIRVAPIPGQAACYLRLERVLVLPAQSSDAAGGNVLGLADWQQARCHAIIGDQVLELGTVARLKKAMADLGTGKRGPTRDGLALGA